MLSKIQVFNTCIALIDNKIQSLEKVLQELTEGIENESKSSAGDKHETSRAMMHNEQEKISKQLLETSLQKGLLEQIGSSPTENEIQLGSFIKTDKGYLFLAIALGKIKVEETDIFVLSNQSPLGYKLMGLKKHESAVINGIKYLVEDFC
jgi:hypothetical protein